ncbi:hypothetical protein LTR36_003966 [Oleoguttula mirabilis]|uniref:Uncharacterized protein n=1 Tax=Oleoguttula mirabilis TaxID=1507867 RepID=A0AAV9JHQ7_9PEZI|nr:hypothetical protein LTR36_003966 [Oleoguttula mirabilis]
MATITTTIETRLSKAHPLSGPAPLYKVSNLTTTEKPTPKPAGLRKTSPGEVTRKLRQKRFGNVLEGGDLEKCMGAGTPHQATHYGDLSRTSTAKTTTPGPAYHPKLEPLDLVRKSRNRLAHVYDSDPVQPIKGLGTPTQVRNTGDLTDANHITDDNQMLSGRGCSVILARERSRSPERRLDGAREWFDYMVDTHREHDARRFCCHPKYQRYTRPEKLRIPEPSTALDAGGKQDEAHTAAGATHALERAETHSEEGTEIVERRDDRVTVEPVTYDRVSMSALWAGISWNTFNR